MQGGAGGQHGRSRHARRATDHGHIAEAAFVRRVWTTAQRGCAAVTRAGAGNRGHGCTCGVHLQGVQPDAAGRVAPVRREQARLEREQAECRVRPHNGTRAVTGVGVQARGHVDGQDGGAGAIHVGHPRGHTAFGWAGGTDAEQRVQAQVIGRRGRVCKHDAGVCRTLPRRSGGGAGGVDLAKPGDNGRCAAALQAGRGLQPVTAVVAGAGRHPHGLRMRGDGQRQPGAGVAGTLHQGVGRHLCQGDVFDTAGRRHVEQGPWGRRVDGAQGFGHGGRVRIRRSRLRGTGAPPGRRCGWGWRP